MKLTKKEIATIIEALKTVISDYETPRERRTAEKKLLAKLEQGEGNNITPYAQAGSSRTGGLRNMTAAKISKVLGFKPNVQDDPDKVVNSWGFKVDGKVCGIWDYYGSHKQGEFSICGDPKIFAKLFGEENVNG